MGIKSGQTDYVTRNVESTILYRLMLTKIPLCLSHTTYEALCQVVSEAT